MTTYDVFDRKMISNVHKMEIRLELEFTAFDVH